MAQLTGNCPGCDKPFAIEHTELMTACCPDCDEMLKISCDGCCRDFASSELEGGNCEDCVESNKRIAARERRLETIDGRGDYLRDMQREAQ